MAALWCGEPEYGWIVKGLVKWPKPLRASLLRWVGNCGFGLWCEAASPRIGTELVDVDSSMISVCKADVDIKTAHGCLWVCGVRRWEFCERLLTANANGPSALAVCPTRCRVTRRGSCSRGRASSPFSTLVRHAPASFSTSLTGSHSRGPAIVCFFSTMDPRCSAGSAFLFDRPAYISALQVVNRSAMVGGYLGCNQAAPNVIDVAILGFEG